MTLRLKRTEGFSGTVVDETGKPVAGASVKLTSIDGLAATLLQGRLEPDAGVGLTAADGTFRLNPQHPPLAVAAVAPQGFALVPVEDLRTTHRVRLEPYGTIEGTYRGGTEDDHIARLTLALFSGEDSPQPGISGSWNAPEILVSSGATFTCPRDYEILGPRNRGSHPSWAATREASCRTNSVPAILPSPTPTRSTPVATSAPPAAHGSVPPGVRKVHPQRSRHPASPRGTISLSTLQT